MRPPGFWSLTPDTGDWRSTILTPLGSLYAAATARRLRRSGIALDCPVICVGNINAGGTGKTPTVMALVERLKARGRSPQIVTRGYGGTARGVMRVDPARHPASLVGDEPLLLSAFAPTWIARDRAAGGRAAVADAADAVVLDDGFQNPAIDKDLSIVVVDAWAGFGNGRVIPAGPLREKVETGLARADMVLSIGGPEDQRRFDRLWGERITCPHLRGALRPLLTGMPWAGLRALAFAGIGRPEKFFGTLEELGATLVRAEALDDHQPLSAALLSRLERDAASLNAQLVTTEKDAVRLPAAFRSRVLTLPVRLALDDPAPLDAALDRLGL
ncbi:lipid-A-disaccharide kinase [Palleronia aestuarii]|uniref:Tetraacyldisaccharide 4'-kinase n=1 Tax=Palleronia aestuarii TaxID=568105 RepID=A0A2W7NZA3_9RHOB|nr:tetraacyldisaccharide 4'-kinase [Palleronia aestuarii]PZX16532.1 lipid-A-disaccharide kinase [Palleronia aestuarii]